MGFMDGPESIDLDSWPRREHFSHYLEAVPCTYALTVELDVTAFAAALRGSARKTYLAQIWALASIVNRHAEFRTCLTDSGTPAVWPRLDPAFTVFNEERETFAVVWTPYTPDFGVFHEAAAALLAQHRTATVFSPQGEQPANTFDVSSLPWLSFTGFTLQIRNGWDHLLPIFTLGRYIERNGNTYMPVAVQVHHAVADGFHTSRLLNELQALLADPSWAN
jgi:chloramphenicol O-acetyltransferase type A